MCETRELSANLSYEQASERTDRETRPMRSDQALRGTCRRVNPCAIGPPSCRSSVVARDAVELVLERK